MRHLTHCCGHSFLFVVDDEPESREALLVTLAHYCQRKALPFDLDANALDVMVAFELDDDESFAVFEGAFG